jgi:ABC-type bacteriocin/lantibiotic exporter with double-glycine peptidase domain
MIFEKSLKHPILCLKKYTVSEVINYSQVDAQRMTYMGYQLSAILFTPLQVTIGIWLMYNFIGISFLSGTAVMILTICLTFFSSRFSKRANEDVLKAKDARMKVTDEIFNIIRFIKINAFEKYFFNKLNTKRQIELQYNKKRLMYTIFIIFTYWLATPLILSMTFLTFILLGNQMSTTQAFTTIMLFGILQTPIRMIPTALS